MSSKDEAFARLADQMADQYITTGGGGSDEELVEALQQYTACDVADALTALGRMTDCGGFIPGPSMYSPRRQEGPTKIVGPIHLVEYAPVSDPRKEITPHYIDSVPKGSVLVIAAPPEATCAVYGGLMSARAQALGVGGTIVLGRIRDLEEHRSIGFPVWANDVGTTSPKGVLKVVHTGVESSHHGVDVQCGAKKITIINNDYIIADLNGVVCIPLEVVQDVLEWLHARGDGEERMMEAIKGGMSFVEASKRYRM